MAHLAFVFDEQLVHCVYFIVITKNLQKVEGGIKKTSVSEYLVCPSTWPGTVVSVSYILSLLSNNNVIFQ